MTALLRSTAGSPDQPAALPLPTVPPLCPGSATAPGCWVPVPVGDPAVERSWRDLEAEREASGVPISRVAWECSHNPRLPEMPARSHRPATEGQRLFGRLFAVDYDERLRRRAS